LEGPLQSWGTTSKFEIRETAAAPSKSGVIGLCGAALGMARDDVAQIARLAALRLAVRVDRPGTKLRDYHTVMFVDPEEHAVTAVTERFYLADASFLVALGGDDEALVTAVAVALANPQWTLFLGRKACPPAVPVLVGTTALTPEEAVRAFPAASQVAATHLMVLVETTGQPQPEDVSHQDVPESFEIYHRRHARRFVHTEWVAAASLPQEAP
jgi:CRISPR system Cascade subunit CasD